MKHLKKLSVVLMLTALFSVTFTSCIDNEVSPLVEAIYEAQADLIAAQAGVQNAEAALLLAQAEATQAQADYTAAQTAQVEVETAGMEADNAYEAAQREQYLLKLVAETNLAVATAQNDLALAQVQFDIDMAAAIAAMEAAGAQLAVGYAWDYALAMNHANDLMQDLLQAQADLASAELMQNGNVSWEYYLAQLQGDVAVNMAAKANLETAIADLEAYIANPTTPEAIISGLKAQNEAYHDAMDAKEIEMQVQWNKIMAIYEQDDIRDDVVSRTYDSLDEHNDAVDDKNDRLDWIETAEDNIDMWQLAIDDYDATLLAFQTAVDDAQTAYDAAVTAEATAEANSDAADALEAAELAELTLIQNDIADLYLSLQNAITLLATLEAGEAPLLATKAAADAALIAAQAAQVVAQGEYDLRKANFEANPAGVTWFAGADGIMGDHTDALTSYLYVVTANAYPTANATGTSTVTPGSAPLTGAAVSLEAVVDDSVGAWNDVAVAGDYYNVEADDTSDTNANLLNIEVADLDAAKAITAAAQLAVDNAQAALDTYADDLLAAQEDYLYKKGLYEDGVAIEAAAQAEYDAAAAAAVTAQDIEDDAEALVISTDADLTDANNDLATFLLLPDEDGLQALIDAAILDIAGWNQDIANIQPIIDAKFVVVSGLLVELTDAGVEYTFEMEVDGTGTLVITNFGVLSSLYPDIHAQIIAEWQVYWTMEQELEALDNAHDLNADLISAYGWGSDDLEDLADYLADLQDDLATAIYDIEVAEQALASAQVEENAAEAYISYLEALVTTLEQRHANTLAIAAKYKALMDAALAS
ncbi:MAG: hypothetical protein ACYCZ2_07680 [Lutibacter sp.]|nr:MAG: hypothetical protein APF83_06730 [Lutibacter sp. BRH_c52]